MRVWVGMKRCGKGLDHCLSLVTDCQGLRKIPCASGRRPWAAMLLTPVGWSRKLGVSPWERPRPRRVGVARPLFNGPSGVQLHIENPSVSCNDPPFPNGEIEAQRSPVTCPRSHGKNRMDASGKIKKSPLTSIPWPSNSLSRGKGTDCLAVF